MSRQNFNTIQCSKCQHFRMSRHFRMSYPSRRFNAATAGTSSECRQAMLISTVPIAGCSTDFIHQQFTEHTSEIRQEFTEHTSEVSTINRCGHLQEGAFNTFLTKTQTTAQISLAPFCPTICLSVPDKIWFGGNRVKRCYALRAFVSGHVDP
mmetsp:Transcript_46281/g.83642  ORF Transcript_46281/g.83642 Transcript_46281/m.83642 type:complete len:152 (+) Transcript_46281:601-1056(+)